MGRDRPGSVAVSRRPMTCAGTTANRAPTVLAPSHPSENLPRVADSDAAAVDRKPRIAAGSIDQREGTLAVADQRLQSLAQTLKLSARVQFKEHVVDLLQLRKQRLERFYALGSKG